MKRKTKVFKLIVKASIVFIFGALCGGLLAYRNRDKLYCKMKEMSDKHLALYLLMTDWVKIKQEKKSIADYLKKEGFETIAVYGMNYVGEALLNELVGSGIQVAYGIDQKANEIYSEIDLVTPNDELRKVDAIIVTPIYFFDEIEGMLRGKVDCPIISIEDIMYEI